MTPLLRPPAAGCRIVRCRPRLGSIYGWGNRINQMIRMNRIGKTFWGLRRPGSAPVTGERYEVDIRPRRGCADDIVSSWQALRENGRTEVRNVV